MSKAFQTKEEADIVEEAEVAQARAPQRNLQGLKILDRSS